MTTVAEARAIAEPIYIKAAPMTGGELASFDDDAVVNNQSRWWFRRWEFK